MEKVTYGVKRGEGGVHEGAGHFAAGSLENCKPAQLPWWNISPRARVVPEPRMVHRPPIKIFEIMEKANTAMDNTSIHFTIKNNIVQKNVALLQGICKPVLRKHDAQLTKWIASAELAHTDEAKEAVYSLAESASCALMDQALSAKLGQTSDRAHSLVLLRQPLHHKVKSIFVNVNLDALRSDDERPALEKLLKAHGDWLEDRCRLWLEAQGVRRWSVAAQPDNLDATGAPSVEPVYYVTENDLRAHQLKALGYEWCTPDFLFVDAQGLPVRVPVTFRKPHAAAAAAAAMKSPPKFWATVLEVKGHFVVQGLTDDADERKVLNQLHRYSDVFGPPLMLQKRGFTEATARAMVSKFQSSGRPRHLAPGVVTVDINRLPETKLRNPWACAVPDNYTRDLKYFNIDKTHHRPPNSQFPNASQGAVLEAWMRVSLDAAGAASQDRALLRQLRSEVRTYLTKHLGQWSADGADKYLFEGWEGRMFASNLVAGRLAVESAQAQAELAAEAAEAAEALAQVVIESEADVEDWEDREDAIDDGL
jgi:hypothetical protein